MPSYGQPRNPLGAPGTTSFAPLPGRVKPLPGGRTPQTMTRPGQLPGMPVPQAPSGGIFKAPGGRPPGGVLTLPPGGMPKAPGISGQQPGRPRFRRPMPSAPPPPIAPGGEGPPPPLPGVPPINSAPPPPSAPLPPGQAGVTSGGAASPLNVPQDFMQFLFNAYPDIVKRYPDLFNMFQPAAAAPQPQGLLIPPTGGVNLG